MSDVLKNLPRIQLANLPTPLVPLPNLSDQLNVELWVKRDDLTGLAFGGNKTRKLELLAAEAINQGCDTLVTTGAIQSNHCRQTAAAAARLGLACSLILVGEKPAGAQANLLLDQLLGAEVHWTTKENQDITINTVHESLRQDGHRPYAIPYGGSNPLGVAAYTLATQELLEQDPSFDLIVLASSSGGTQAGLLLGANLAGFEGQILGISIEPAADELKAIIRNLISETAHEFNLPVGDKPLTVNVDDRFLGQGYAVMGQLERQAIELFAQTESLLLDPVYTGRAGGGLLQLIKEGTIPAGQKVLFWHTGGTPALFAYNQQLNRQD